jgi:hypothetical protein
MISDKALFALRGLSEGTHIVTPEGDIWKIEADADGPAGPAGCDFKQTLGELLKDRDILHRRVRSNEGYIQVLEQYTKK